MADQPSTKLTILAVTSDHVDRLFTKWAYMFEDEYCLILKSKLEERVQNFYSDLLIESDEKEQLIKDDISALRAEAAEVRRLLHKQLDIGDRPDDMPLNVWVQKLDKSIEHLREELRLRRAEICELLLQQDQLCEELGELPLPLLADPLPKPEEMSTFCNHLEHLRAERMRRMEELFQLRSQIKHDMKLLGMRPKTVADEHLLSQANQSLTPDIFEKLRFMQKEFAAQVQELRERIDDMREKIHVLWDRLQESDEYVLRRVREAQPYTQATYDILNEELQRCQKLRRQNLKVFIEQLRLEIGKWWDLTLKSQQERKRFSNFYNECYTEDLLELHELELDDLKSFYNSNKEIFELYASRVEIWARMEALEAKANEPNRFNNRGGQLLKEERERKAISTKLPKIEQQITDLVQAYELRSHSPFLVHGENILEQMANDWVRIRQAKEQQSSARKLAVTTPSAGGKMLPPLPPGSTVPRTPLALRNMSALSTSTMSLRKTPSNLQLSSMTGSAAKTTGNLHKRKMPLSVNGGNPQTPNAKRSLMKTLSNLKASPALRMPISTRPLAVKQKTPNPKIRKVRVLENTLRRSSGLGRRSIGHGGRKERPKLPMPGIRVQAPSSEEDDEFVADENAYNDTYDSFEKSIEPAARSSILPQGVGSSYHALKLRKRL